MQQKGLSLEPVEIQQLQSTGVYTVKRIRLPKSSTTKSNALAIVAGLFVLLTIGAPYLPSPQVTLPQDIPGIEVAGMDPQMCIGYDSLKKSWGADTGLCPANHAFYGVDDPAGASGPAKKIKVSMACCPLPAKDILSDKHVYSTQECPKDHVATGSKEEGSGDNLVRSMRCTKINTYRYQLGDATQGVYWGDGAAGWRGSKRIAWDNIPASMRYAHGRQSVNKWDVDGCVGYPWGSLLTSKRSKNCSSFSFRQLQYSGNLLSDPVAGSAVQMIPKCQEVKNADSPTAECKS